MPTVEAIPRGYTSLTAYLISNDANAAIAFYQNAFGAEELFRMPMGDKIAHAELQIGNARMMLADEFPEMKAYSAKHYGGSPVSFMIYVTDVDAAYTRAIDAGCEKIEAPVDQFWGDRMGKLLDPFGIQWSIATHIEDVSAEEMEKRMDEFAKQMEGQ
ncbi:VOC family protein [Aliiglaciecola sp. CAU 1673]|uniref:VOC family protein n=1 Tax=Aliiglaciecola sp. CAU 1673 TaxID=3032595 RepID=UPI0023DA49F9|nr:VOC family protein [Aliiglaciecola sp. CAU 1673]MDF2178592.1 VOC family protein [Aliiglaciecola sp. CAU 1673]